METLIINGKKYELSKSSYESLNSYINRLRSYTKDNNIDSDLITDLEERISEKLDSIKGNITQKHVIDIINSLGEIEEIFSEDTPEEDFKKTISGTKKGLIIFIKKTINFFKNLNPKSLISSIANLIKATWKSTTRVIKYTLQKTIDLLKYIFSNSIDLIKFCIKNIFYILIFLFFAFGSGFLMILGPIVFTDLTISNQEIFYYLDDTTRYAVLAAFVSCLTITIFIFGAIIKKTLIPTFIAILAFITLFVSGFFIIHGAYSIASNYTNEYKKSYEYSFDIKNQTAVIENFYAMHSSGDFDIIPGYTQLELYKSPDEKVRFDVTAKIKAKDSKKGQEILKKLNEIKIENKNGIFEFQRKNPLFKENVPLTFISYEIKIYIPEFHNIKINNYYRYNHRIKNIANYPVEYDRNTRYIRCYKKELFYDDEQDAFTCKPTQNEINETIEVLKDAYNRSYKRYRR